MAYNTRGDLRARVKEYLDGRTDLDSKINEWIDDTRRALATQYYRFSYLYTESTLTTSGGVARYALPCDYLGHLNLFIGTKKLVRIAPNEFDSLHGDTLIPQFLQTSGNITSGTPDYYIDRGTAIDLWPVPTGAHTLTIKYYAQPAAFSQDTDYDYITTFYPEAVIMGAAYRGALYLEDTDKQAKYEQEFNKHVAMLLANEKDRKTDDLGRRWKSYKDFSLVQFKRIMRTS